MTPLVTTKSKRWGYENEYRIVKFDSSRKIVNIPEDAVLEIVLGCNMSDKDKDALHELAKKKFPKAKVFETKINEEEFKLDFLPIIK